MNEVEPKNIDMQSNKVSVKELNEVLSLFTSGKNKKFLGMNIDRIDIVFVAGLLLYYKSNKQNNWTKKEITYLLENNQKRFEVSQYFKQCKDLYEIDANDAFSKFSYVITDPEKQKNETETNLTNKEEEKNKEEEFSKVFAPILFVDEYYIDHWFRLKDDDEINNKIKTMRLNCIDKIKMNEFIDQSMNNSLQYYPNRSTFESYFKDLKDNKLKTKPPIFAFIFSLVYHQLARHTDHSNEKQRKTLDDFKKVMYQIWQFSEQYFRGLYELAKNIVEHSGTGKNDGMGMITLRAYNFGDYDLENESSTKMKMLEIHVFDYGKMGIVPKFVEFTNAKVAELEQQIEKLKKENKLESIKSKEKVLRCYKNDTNTLKINYTLKNYIEKDLEQQSIRYIAHYGIKRFYQIIQQYGGEMFIFSQSDNYKDYYKEEMVAKDKIVSNGLSGTSYFFQIPFDKKKFDTQNINKNLIETLSSGTNFPQSLKRVFDIKQEAVKLENLTQITQLNQNTILFVEFDTKIDKQNADMLYAELDNLQQIGDATIAINCRKKIDDSSVFLRFLGYLSFEHSQPFIIYDLEYEKYKEMLDYNIAFYDTKENSENFWHENNGILIFTEYNNFHFADILFGKNRKIFYLINKIVSNTFPNTIFITGNKDEFKSDDEFRIPENLREHFFYNDSLLPFDTILKNSEGRELFLSNLKIILENDLTKKKKEDNALDNYILNFDGYHISDTHFKIGNKIHSEDFYYAKQLFQNSFYTTRLAIYLAKKINENLNDNIKQIALVGYEMYSELLLSLIRKFLKEVYKYDVSHFVAQQEDDKLIFLQKDVFKKFIEDEYKNRTTVIIVPIASTGSTAQKIVETIRNEVIKADELKYLLFSYNVLWARDEELEFEDLIVEEIPINKTEKIKQEPIIVLPAKWQELENCEWCFPQGKNEQRPLFKTDKSSITPAIIFDKPEGKSIALTSQNKDREIPSNIDFDEINFCDSLKYHKVRRNNQFLIYSTDTEKLIEDNEQKINDWLKRVRNRLESGRDGLKSTDRIIIISPCHETNSGFINLVNEKVFNSSATIIHYQTDVDFDQNFKCFNGNLLKGAKTFCVDDSMISGGNFIKVLDLIRNAIGDFKEFDGTIVLSDKSEPFKHNRFVQYSNKYFAFANYNQPAALALSSHRPLEHEQKKYAMLAQKSLHDVLKHVFQENSDKLNPEKASDKNEEKDIQRHERMFRITHKIYEYFANKGKGKDINSISTLDDFQKELELDKGNKRYENKLALLKVLAQYPFVLYEQLKKKTFEWHNEWLGNKISEFNKKIDKTNSSNNFSQEKYQEQFTYDSLKELKFLIRRASLLGNYSVLENKFLELLSKVFKLIEMGKIKKYTSKEEIRKKEIEQKDLFGNKPKAKIDKVYIVYESQALEEDDNKNLEDFHIFLLRNYVEMIVPNGWFAIKLVENLNAIKDQFTTNKAEQFLRMLKIEAAIVIDDFVNMIEKEHKYKWRDMYKYTLETKHESEKLLNTDFITTLDYIGDFLNHETYRKINETNKYKIIKKFLQEENDDFKNYLWIKQLIFSDLDKNSNLPKNIGYQKKIDAIIKKMKAFFIADRNVQAFFIVTDGQEIPYVLYSENNNILYRFYEEYKGDKQNDCKTKTIIDFLYGKECITSNAPETTAEFLLENDKWKNIYTNEDVKLDFLPPETNWLYLIRISQMNDEYSGSKEKNRFKTMGLLGFYSTAFKAEDLKNNILPKQFLMLLRQDMGKFIGRHHKNDEFSGLITEKEKEQYQFVMRHGVKTYMDAIDDNLKLIQSEYKDYLKTLFRYLANKHNIISKLSNSKRSYEAVTFQKIVDEFEQYKFIFTLYVGGKSPYSSENVSKFVYLNSILDSDSIEYEFPQDYLSDLVFELLYNIRKHIILKNIDVITETKKLEIKIYIENKILIIENNHCTASPSIFEDKSHGLNLLEKIWLSYNLGRIKYYRTGNDLFRAEIPLKKYDDERK